MMKQELKIGFVGFGYMAQAIAKGWIHSGEIIPKQLYASARNQDKLKDNTSHLGIQTVETNEELINAVDVVIIAVKPYQIRGIFEPLKEKLVSKVIVSLAVNILAEDFSAYLLDGTQHLSTLPNTPVAIREGIVIFEDNHTLRAENFALVKELFELISHVESIPTDQMGIAGLIAGSAPAFADLFIEALSDAGVKHGLDRKAAYRLASKMMSGAGELQLQTGKHPGELKDEITSPGGTTIKGIASLEKNNFRGTVIDAVDAILED